MNGEMDSSAKEPVWVQDDLLKLLDAIKVNLPEKDLTKYKTSESHLDWEKVAFNSYSGEMCKQKWKEVSREIRKFRTLTELIVDAQDYVKNPYKGKKLKKHPDFPKKPLTPYFRFFMEKRAKYAKLHPEMSNLDLTKILSKKYKELPDRKKEKYVKDFLREKETFMLSMMKFKQDHPDLLENVNKKSNVPEKPKTPQQLWYCHEKKAFLKARPDATTKDIKDSLGKQWPQLSDKKRLKWITKSLEQQKLYEEKMREFIQQHPEMNMTEGNIVKSTLTKAERQLKDKFDGRPDKPPSNGYSMFCAELMSSMKDVPSTERMVMCSQRWKLLTQSEKEAYQKRCEQKKKEYEVEMNRYLLSISEEEQHRILSEQKMGSFKKGGGGSSPASKKKNSKAKSSTEKPKPPVSAMFIFSEEKRPKLQQERSDLSDMELTRLLARMWNELSDKKKEKYKNLEMTLKAESEKQSKDDKGKLPETPKTAQEIWQQSVIGDYLARFKNDRGKAQKAMEATWNTMEKKEKIMWIKKAAEDQKRYERELSEMRSPAPVIIPGKKMKFDGEPKKPPSNGYQKFSQEMLSNGELNHLPMKERMGEIGGRWQRLPQKEKDRYKRLAEEKQRQYKVLLEKWLASLSSQEKATYKEYNSLKRRSTSKPGATAAKVKPKAKQSDEEEEDDDDDDDDDEDDDDEEKESDDGSSSDDSDDDDDDEDDNEDVEDEEVEDKENKSESSSSASSSDDSSGSDSD
ncbi:nucleolar transcription factor 1-like [Sinocyclocheilus rhinocerous]|uniref:nucleolar transcription factor 1-like n=1 Tax=Sinocyclocheilus rhinocerous TaxID=307959 RepID=UPI0007B8B6E6|nr:PREDICTED: nucleolar transcription factor 1-like [Sinocyclocheilus rhinocerous]XP_016368303.1 PREDICTED: nucleolar transcription factor 1-like [Sinocyclocheilus rhinocerous]XP_016368305.1 PREDICTED: nucleolar transcription factor 1-like [Sinocyclocheilus rhinocerous]XP_016368306.1 PREDICTED: nucleolar transcription factor 1-like [Sinocyclocheilus rhinocerous]XP_016368307.1 PREDICTED: nucleolar transcription factor 1-like [Sinocyclocheilus rhinocerous]